MLGGSGEGAPGELAGRKWRARQGGARGLEGTGEVMGMARQTSPTPSSRPRAKGSTLTLSTSAGSLATERRSRCSSVSKVSWANLVPPLNTAGNMHSGGEIFTALGGRGTTECGVSGILDLDSSNLHRIRLPNH